MFLPIGTDNPLHRRPMANYALIVVNAAIFVPMALAAQGGVAGDWVQRFYDALILNPARPQLYQFVTYAFMHAGWGHILGNMFFLYIFGNNVNDKLGNLGYLTLYFAAAIFSGMGHAWISPNPILGASGAVATVTGAYMVLFPKTYVHVLYFFFFIGTTDIPALYFILFKLVIYDNIIVPKLPGGMSNVSHGAHIAGYIFGIVVPLVMLALKLLPHSPYDLWALLRRWRRRSQYRSMVDRGFDPFAGKVPQDTSVRAAAVESQSAPEPSSPIAKLRHEIAEAANASDLAGASQAYLRLLELDSAQVMPQQQQLDIANKLMQSGRHADAARAYELFLERYRRYPFLEQVQLMLGLICSRYLDRKELARQHLEAALSNLRDPGQQQMCRDELNRLAKA